MLLGWKVEVVYSFSVIKLLSCICMLHRGLAPIEANPIEAKGKKRGNIPIQANPRNSAVTSETWIQIRINTAVAAIKLYILNLFL